MAGVWEKGTRRQGDKEKKGPERSRVVLEFLESKICGNLRNLWINKGLGC
jgi:hypothetical protein